MDFHSFCSTLFRVKSLADHGRTHILHLLGWVLSPSFVQQPDAESMRPAVGTVG